MTTKQRKALLNAEQPQTCLKLMPVIQGSVRIKPGTVIGHLYVNRVSGSECEVDIDPVGTGVLDCVEHQFPDPLEEQHANITCLRVGLRVGGDIHDNAVLFLCPSC